MKIKTTISEKRTRNREIRLQVRWEMISSCSYIYENAEDNTQSYSNFLELEWEC